MPCSRLKEQEIRSDKLKGGKIISLAVVLLTLAACTSISVDARRDVAFGVAANAGFQSFNVKTNSFRLAGFYRVGKPQKPISLYIEGDGFAWIDRYTISSNPTPRNPLALKLAGLDQASNVVYFARPCQYIDLSQERYCNKRYWTSHRFSKDVLSSYNQALEQIKTKFNPTGFHLVGFSGGAAIVALLAAQRSDVLSLRTIAGNLDHVALNRARKVSPLRGSLNPISVAHKLKATPQIHYSGGNDEVVPGWVSQAFVRAVGRGKCVIARTIASASHLEGWLAVWKTLNREIPVC
jgi:dienelactone hydrolase